MRREDDTKYRNSSPNDDKRKERVPKPSSLGARKGSKDQEEQLTLEVDTEEPTTSTGVGLAKGAKPNLDTDDKQRTKGRKSRLKSKYGENADIEKRAENVAKPEAAKEDSKLGLTKGDTAHKRTSFSKAVPLQSAAVFQPGQSGLPQGPSQSVPQRRTSITTKEHNQSLPDQGASQSSSQRRQSLTTQGANQLTEQRSNSVPPQGQVVSERRRRSVSPPVQGVLRSQRNPSITQQDTSISFLQGQNQSTQRRQSEPPLQGQSKWDAQRSRAASQQGQSPIGQGPSASQRVPQPGQNPPASQRYLPSTQQTRREWGSQRSHSVPPSQPGSQRNQNVPKHTHVNLMCGTSKQKDSEAYMEKSKTDETKQVKEIKTSNLKTKKGKGRLVEEAKPKKVVHFMPSSSSSSIEAAESSKSEKDSDKKPDQKKD